MDFSFEEKSAWGTLVAIVLAGWWYFPKALVVVRTSESAVALVAVSAIWVILLVIVEVVYHTLIAVASPDDAGKSDERDRLIDLRAERNSSVVIGISLFSLIGWIIAQSILGAYPVPQPLEIVVLILLAITVSELAKLMSQIWYYRVGS